jgi:DNA-binding winged helix-turn-helix (wHTH) protein/Tol biopolymer transport system component
VEYHFGPFRIDLSSLRLLRGDEPIPIAPKAFDTLLVLVQQRDRLLLKDELLHAVWADAFVSEDSLTQNITALRRALGDDPANPQFIATIPRRGYRFVAAVTEHVRGHEVSAGPASTAPIDVDKGTVAPRTVVTPSPATRRSLWIAVPLGILVLLGLVMVARWAAAPAATRSSPLRLNVDAPAGTRLLSAVVSPDGRELALVAEDIRSRAVRLWVRPLDAGMAKTLDGTDGAAHPFWSPDSQSIAFFANRTLKRVAATGGTIQTIAPIIGLTASGGTWGPNGTILFAHFRSGVNVVPAAGGDTKPLTTLDAQAGEAAHRWPSFLPDGRHFLYSVVAASPARTGTYLASIDAPTGTRILADSGATYAPPGYLVFVRERALMAQAFDPGTFKVIGQPVVLAGEVTEPVVTNSAAISASSSGLLTYTAVTSNAATRRMRLVWFNRTGQQVGEVSAPTSLTNPTLSPDGRRLLAGSGADVWLIDLDRGVSTRLVAGNTPLLSPDGDQIAFTSGGEGGTVDIHLRALADGAKDRRLVHSAEHKIVNDWTRDGRYLIYSITTARTGVDLWAVPTAGPPEPFPLVVTPASEFEAQVSPDGRWLAYASDESGVWEVYVQAFPGGGGKLAVSTGGGSEPQWRHDGRELYYLSADLTLQAVEILPGPQLQIKRAVALFRAPVPVSELNARRNHYTVSADGQRFLMNAGDTAEESVAVVVGWTAALGR